MHSLRMLLLTPLSLALIACATTGDADRPQPGLKLSSEADRLTIWIDGEVFCEYRFRDNQKYPYFYPLNGPLTQRSVTTESSEPYPHHHSLFFACDRVNGGNYWQEGLERGRIAQESITVEVAEGDKVSFVCQNLWQRPGALAPFRDTRRVTISAPSDALRIIDVTIVLEALSTVTIKQTNHALFAARMRPELSVKSGGSLTNAAGAEGETATFAQTSAWMDASGPVSHKGRAGIEGLAILTHPDNPWAPSQWFTRDYGFFSPTPMHWLAGGSLELQKGETKTLRYRVLVHAGDAGDIDVAAEYARWSIEK